MSIRPASDILLDVAQAADPLKSRVAMERLARLAPDNEISPNDFSTALATTKRDRTDPHHQIALLGGGTSGPRPMADAKTKAYEGLEHLVLQNLVETMLPKDAGEIFGRGTAGDIWRSMLADQLAGAIGKTIDLGLAKGVAPGPVPEATSRMPNHSGDPKRPTAV